MSAPNQDVKAEGLKLTDDERAFLKAVRRFLEAEHVHARAISEHMDKGGPAMQDWSHSRDDVDLAHADLMNFPALLCDLIAAKLGASLHDDLASLPPTSTTEGPDQ